MAQIRVHVLNFHGIFSHIEIVLENLSVEPAMYYGINRWDYPAYAWGKGHQNYFGPASSTYRFEIAEDPLTLSREWKSYWNKTQSQAGILTHNCAVAAQWFLTNSAGIPEPGLSNISANHLALGIVWPSIIPCPVTLPGRIMSNTKFYVEAIRHPDIAFQYSKLFLYASMTLAILAIAASVFALLLAATVFTGGMATLTATSSVAAGAASAYGFFTAFNILSAQNVAEELKNSKTEHPLQNPKQ